jgi:hypothetical protein
MLVYLFGMLAIAAVLMLAGWAAVAGIRVLRGFVRSFWPHS